MRKYNYLQLILLFITVVLARTVYGVCVNFDEDQKIAFLQDHAQIIALGLKSYLNNAWPYFGPDVVYNNSQLPGALQGLFIAVPVTIFPSAYAPFIFLNLMVTGVLFLFAWYASIHFPSIPKWFVYAYVLLAPWFIYYGATIINPSYLLIAGVPFFIAFLESLEVFSKNILSKRACFFIMGLSIGFSLQFNLSWVLLPFFTFASFWDTYKTKGFRALFTAMAFSAAGFLLISLTLFPTLIKYGLHAGGSGSMISFNVKNLVNIDIATRFLSLASLDVLQFVEIRAGGFFEFLKTTWWTAIFTVFAMLIGFLTVIYLVFSLVKKSSDHQFRYFRFITIGSMLLIYLSYLFTSRELSTFTMLILAPIPLWFFFYGIEQLVEWKYFKTLALVSVLAFIIHHTALAYALALGTQADREIEKMNLALQQKDLRVFALRRIPNWEIAERSARWIRSETKNEIWYRNSFDLYSKEIMPDQLNSKNYYSKSYSATVDSLSIFSPELNIDWRSIHRPKKVDIAFMEFFESYSDAYVAVSIETENKNWFWNALPICTTQQKKGSWSPFHCSIELPPLPSKELRLKVYVVIPSERKDKFPSVLIDDFSICFTK